MVDDNRYGLFIDGEWIPGESYYSVRNKFSGEVIAMVTESSRQDVESAVSSSKEAFRTSNLTPYRRYEILQAAANILQEQREDIARTMSLETGGTIRESRVEVDRATQDFILSAEEAKRISGEVIPIQASPGAENRFAVAMRFPVGVVCAITPFNAPLSLAAHKIAPALAAGCTVVLKPSPAAPLTGLRFGQLLSEAGLPKGHLNIVTGSRNEVGEWLVQDERIDFYTFTGSAAIGERIKANSGLRRVTLELGNSSAVIVMEDADLDRALPMFARGAFRKAGQVCVSVQRIYVQRDIYDEFVSRLADLAANLKVGDPLDERTDVGPMISDAAAARAESWVHEAVQSGARLATGGTRNGALFAPTVLADVKADMKVVCEEVFAPVVSVAPFDTREEAVLLVNETRYGLQAGVFTESLETAMYFARRLEVGGVNINDTSNFRADLMPYGGVKDSGIGREGPKYAIEEMTEIRMLTFNLRQ
ncbi:aldehyde dehydrogenase family protein [Alicyclobacillus mengziensis]|uniref:3-sulfolactaldehyde dehydrogenase n=1 Tax=Alicyclobacillus mengziensis TaxID=2931921 RepID=A0A9X7VXA2_9BACL|nr:aldehyde dehydrogenase family protein [Alicyclobacillus mengziensis]